MVLKIASTQYNPQKKMKASHQSNYPDLTYGNLLFLFL